jgi:F-type H+-transporting ATPase subunit b
MFSELIAPSFNFFLLVVLLVVVLRGRVQTGLAERRKFIEEQVLEATRLKNEAEKKLEETSLKLKNIEVEAEQIIQKAKQDAEAMQKKIVQDAMAQAEKILQDSESMALSNIQEFKDEVRKLTVNKAIELSEKVIRTKLSSEDQKRIVHEYVGKVL